MSDLYKDTEVLIMIKKIIWKLNLVELTNLLAF